MIVPAIAILFLTLGARLITVASPIALFGHSFGLPAGAWRILTWGGLRGGISVALALSLPHGTERDAVVGLTYVIVLFSILVQGLTIGALVKRMLVGAVPTRIAPADAR
jgi:CPA1 family monovalent cation:H+ antiporter